MTPLHPLDPALTYFVGVDHGAGPDTTKAVLVNVEPDGKVVVIGEAGNATERMMIAKASAVGNGPIWRRAALLRAMFERGEATLPTVDLTAFDVPDNHKKNRAQRRKEARNGR